MLTFRVLSMDFRWADVLDILLVAFLLYQIYSIVRGSIASRVFLGYLLVYLFYLTVKLAGLSLLTTILEYFISVGALALIIIFQQEIRRFLLIIGKSTHVANSRLFRKLLRPRTAADTALPMKPVMEACKVLAAEFAGGLIVVAKNDSLSKFIQSGEKLDAVLSKRLLVSIFSQYSPLRDGAVIVADGRLCAARCILPASENDELPTTTGFRHRAALGISELTDAAAIAISEQTGRIALAIDGELYPNLTLAQLEEQLTRYLYEPSSAKQRETV
ncbi:diadenylate cyclase CdaA [Tellurirhabdus rosea]|uniref:diadenylate cyclase CdaA n=1 Tax=Tellurirhabdus rosea TaxID=2674997 RepID=UPI00224F0C30|nr:diadenylate cyclase CdaA [Tellurirhabdus rosea]